MNATPPKAGSGRPGIVKTVAALCGVIALIVGGFVYTKVKPQPACSDGTCILFEQVRDLGTFALVDEAGQPFTPAALQGKWSLLFFGYTYCPDICPTTLAQLSQLYSRLEPEYAGNTQVILASVDPARDTPEKLREYVGYFNPTFRGVTGEFLALQQFATSLNIPFRKVPGGGDNYLVDHSGNIAIINPQGHYVGFFKAPHDVDQLLRNYRSIRATRD